MNFKIGFIIGILVFVLLAVVLSVLGTVFKIIAVILIFNVYLWFRFFNPFTKNGRR